MKSIRFLVAVVFLFMMTAMLVSDSNAESWQRKMFHFQIVDEDDQPLTGASARAMINDTAIYHDASIFEAEDSSSAASQAPLTVSSTTANVVFWGDSNSYNVRVTYGGKWDIFKNVGTTRHKLVFLGRNYLMNTAGAASPESAPGMFCFIGNRAYIGIGSFGNATWGPISP